MNASDLYRWMLTSRQFESALSSRNPRWFSTEGEEAAIVGSFAGIREGDIAAPHYRGPFVTYLMRGADMKRLACQAFGKAGGYSKGRSVPFIGPAALGFVPWVAGDLGTSLGIATGAALALQRGGRGRVCVCSFGDGTSNRGDFHENINLAALWKLPIVYVCQNNGWAISQPARSYLPTPIVERAKGYGIPGVALDGNDAEAVHDAVARAMERAAEGKGPTLIEARTWRKGGHWANDQTPYRTAADIPDHPCDPLELMRQRLLDRGLATPTDLERMSAAIATQVDAAIGYAMGQPDAGEPQIGLDEVLAQTSPA